MSVNKYEVFTKIAETGSLTKAAEELSYTQSAVSHILKSLEEEIGARLFIRSKGGVRLTYAGESLLSDAREISRHQNAFRQKAALLSGNRMGKISIGSFSSTSIKWMPDIINSIEEKYPNIEIMLHHMTYHDIENGIMTGELDCGFVTDKHQLDLEFTPIAQDEYKIVLPEGHKLASYEAIPVELLDGEHLILLYEGGNNYDTGQIVSQCRPVIKHMVEEDLVAVPMVRKGLGISILPQLILDCTDTTGVVIKSFAVPRIRTIGLAAKPGASDTPMLTLFYSFVREYLASIDRLITPNL
jgi:DNA-binding transcriptional LysR family regulator